MANLFFTGYEGLNSASMLARRVTTVGASHSFVTGRYDGNGVQTSATDAISVVLSGVPTTVILGTGVRVTTYDGTNQRALVRFRGSSVTHLTLRVKTTSTDTYQVVGPDGSTELGTVVIPFNTWVFLEMRVVISDTVGEVELKVNGVSAFNVTGIDTKNAGAAGVDEVRLNGDSLVAQWDDTYVNDSSGSAPHNTFYGDISVKAVRPAANDTVAFTPLTSTNVSNIDDTTVDDDATYNYGGTVGDKDLFTVSGYTQVIPTDVVLGVALRVHARRESASRTLRPVLKNSSTTVNGTATSLGTVYTELTQYAYVDPATSAAFADAAAVNSLRIGYEVTA